MTTYTLPHNEVGDILDKLRKAKKPETVAEVVDRIKNKPTQPTQEPEPESVLQNSVEQSKPDKPKSAYDFEYGNPKYEKATGEKGEPIPEDPGVTFDNDDFDDRWQAKCLALLLRDKDFYTKHKDIIKSVYFTGQHFRHIYEQVKIQYSEFDTDGIDKDVLRDLVRKLHFDNKIKNADLDSYLLVINGLYEYDSADLDRANPYSSKAVIEFAKKQERQLAIITAGIAYGTHTLELKNVTTEEIDDWLVKRLEAIKSIGGGSAEGLTPATKDEVLNYKDPKWIIKDILALGLVYIFGAYTGTGKSLLLNSIIKAIFTRERCWGKYPVEMCGDVILIDEENPNSIVKNRFSKSGLVDYLEGNVRLHYFHFKGLKISDDACLNTILDYVRKHQPILVVIDSSIRVHDYEENESGEMRQFTDRLRKISNLGPAVAVITHHGYEAKRTRGSSEQPAGVDMEYALIMKDPLDKEDLFREFRSVKEREAPFLPIKLVLDLETYDFKFVEDDSAGDMEILEVWLSEWKGEETPGKTEFQRAVKEKGVTKTRFNKAHREGMAAGRWKELPKEKHGKIPVVLS